MTLGFVGCGTITSAIVAGARAAGHDEPVILSPRNAETAGRLASRFSEVKIAPDNQAVVDQCDLVVLAVRPQVVRDVLSKLRFRADQQILSLVAMMPLATLKSLTGSALSVTRAVPLPSAARRQSPTVICPPNLRIKTLFDALGTAIELEDERVFNAYLASTAIMASYFTFMGTVEDWLTFQGALPDAVHRYVGQMAQGLADAAAATPNGDFIALSKAHQTAGGLNEQMVKQLHEKGLFKELSAGLSDVLKRISSSANQ